MPRTTTAARLGVSLAVGALALSACSGGGTSNGPTANPTTTPTQSATSSSLPSPTGTVDLSKFYGQRLNWNGCDGDFQCATLTVPVDYASPTGATLKLNVLRLRASDQSKRIGSLILNPGGPGGSGVDYARAARVVVDGSVRARYDVVGFDPRGVASSEPVQCLSDRQTDDFLALDGTPDTAAEVFALDRASKTFADECAAKSPKLIAHIGTRDVARDVDVLRGALGDEKLYWLGASYGTFIGATYADMFPTRVGRMVLDGAIDPTLTNVELARGQAKGFEVALQRFVEDCPAHDDCPLPAGTAAGMQRIRDFFAAADKNPLPTDGRPLTEALAQNAVLSYLYAPPGDWEQLRFGLSTAFTGDGSVLLGMLDARIERSDSGRYANNFLAALYAVNALDRPDRAGAVQSAVLASQWVKEAPTWGPFLAWGNLPFHYWLAPATDLPHRITAPGAPPILIVGTTYDPATPYPWAQGLAQQLASGVLLTRVGDGHTGYGMGSECTDRAIDRYLLTGTPPDKGTVCR